VPSARIPNPVHPAPSLVIITIMLTRWQEYGLHVIISVGVINEVIHRKWEAGKPIDNYMIKCRLNPTLCDSGFGLEFCWWDSFMLHLKNLKYCQSV
jgi:hypothetical protein